MKSWEGVLYLENGHLFEGEGFGAKAFRGGEAVFNTGMSGYQEIFTDPSYLEQIVVMGASHIGNTGVNWEDPESTGIHLSGVVTREYCTYPSNWRSKQSLSDYLAKADVPLLSGIDTRDVTQILRDEGAQRGIIFAADEAPNGDKLGYAKKLMEKIPSMEGLELVSRVSCKKPSLYEPSRQGTHGTVVVYDYGAKLNILRHFSTRGFQVWSVPYNYPAQEVMALKPIAVALSNGPGDPAMVQGAVPELQKIIGQVPIFAVCMGHQLLARAVGGSTYKLKFGHHGINHPVMDKNSSQIIITSQNHGFAVKKEDLISKDIFISHENLNDHTVEGFSSEKMKLSSVQFHPEAKPGPNDAAYLFDNFIRGFLK